MKAKSSPKRRKITSSTKHKSAIQRKSISVTKAREVLGDIFGEVNYQKARIVLTSHKKSIAVVPIEDLELLEALEDAHDIYEAKQALKEIKKKGSISFEEMKRRIEDS